jgi:signal peptidase I
VSEPGRAGPGGAGARPPGRRRRLVVRGLLAAAVAGLFLLVSGILPVQAIRVPSDSMAPTVEAGDHLLLDKRDRSADVGDLVVLEDPLGDGPIIKRVVAVGGDEIGFEDGVLVRNGQPVPEPYSDTFLDGVYYGPYLIPEGQVWVLGDNRYDSIDSRDFGPVDAAAVLGQVHLRLLPLPGRVDAP